MLGAEGVALRLTGKAWPYFHLASVFSIERKDLKTLQRAAEKGAKPTAWGDLLVAEQNLWSALVHPLD